MNTFIPKWRDNLGLRTRATLADLNNALIHHCGERVRMYKGSKKMFVGITLPLERIILDEVARSPGRYPKQVCQNLPMIQEVFREHLNRLLEQGAVVGKECNKDFVPKLHLPAQLSATVPLSPPPSPAAFHAAYLAIGKGRGYVRIHRLREHLDWGREAFDTLLLKLMADEQIILQRGDPTSLATEEVRNSFEDINGMLYVTLSWIGRKP